MLRYTVKLFLVISLLAFTSRGLSQQVSFKLVDKKSKQPVAYAHVLLEGIDKAFNKQLITDVNGKVSTKISGKAKVTVSYVGYRTLTDTIKPARKNLVFELTPDILEVSEVVITGQYTPQRVDQSIYKVDVIGKRDIDEVAAENLSGLLEKRLNIKTSYDGALGSSLSLQGLSGQHVKFLINGVPVIGRMNGNIDLEQLNMYNVDHIEVVEGPMSVIYGSNALAGVINIITEDGTDGKVAANVDAYYESVGKYNLNARTSYRTDDHNIALSGGRHFFDGHPETGQRNQFYKPKRQYNVQANYSYNPGTDFKLKYNGRFFDEKILDRGALLEPYYEKAFDKYFTTSRITNDINLKTRFFSDHYFDFQASYSTYNRKKKTYFKDLTTLEQVVTDDPEDHDTTRFDAYRGRGTFTLSDEKRNMNYQLGFDLNYETGSGKRIEGEEKRIGDYAGFFSLKYKPTDELILQPGIRYNYNTMYNAPLVYSLNVKYDIIDKMTFRASYAKGFRAPSLKELYLFFVDINHNIRGNEDLKAEHSKNINFSLNYTHLWEKLSGKFEAGGFHNNIRNIITLARETSVLYTYINVDQYLTKGIFLKTNWYLEPGFKFNAGITYTGRYNRFTADEQVREFAFSTDVSSGLSYNWVTKDVNFSFNYKYTGEVPEFYVEDEQVKEGFFADYHNLDFTAIKHFFNRKMHLSAGVKNIFNNTTIPAVGGTGSVHAGGSGSIPIGWGRTFFIGLSYDYKK